MSSFDKRYNLSKREIEIVQEVILGLRNKEVGEKLFVTEKTVKFHLTNIYKKLGVKSRSQLIVKTMLAHDHDQAAIAPI